jgi:hypothetical protein
LSSFFSFLPSASHLYYDDVRASALLLKIALPVKILCFLSRLNKKEYCLSLSQTFRYDGFILHFDRVAGMAEYE